MVCQADCFRFWPYTWSAGQIVGSTGTASPAVLDKSHFFRLPKAQGASLHALCLSSEHAKLIPNSMLARCRHWGTDAKAPHLFGQTFLWWPCRRRRHGQRGCAQTSRKPRGQKRFRYPYPISAAHLHLNKSGLVQIRGPGGSKQRLRDASLRETRPSH